MKPKWHRNLQILPAPDVLFRLRLINKEEEKEEVGKFLIFDCPFACPVIWLLDLCPRLTCI